MKQDIKGHSEANFPKVSSDGPEHQRMMMGNNEHRLRDLLDHAPGLLWMTDPAGSYYFFNQTWLNFTGRTCEQEAQSGWMAGIHPDDRHARQAIFNDAVQERKAFSIEYRLRRADGEYRWILDRGRPYHSASGVYEGYIGSCVDITEIKAAQHILRRSETVLKFLDSLTTTMKDSLRIDELVQKFAEQAVLSLCDWCYVDLAEANSPTLTRIVVAPPPGFDDQLLATYKNKILDTSVAALSSQVIRSSKTVLLKSPEPLTDKLLEMIGPQSIICTPVFGEHRTIGAVTFVISSLRREFDSSDVSLCEELTHRLSLALENTRLYTAAKTSNLLKDEFLATLSHELRTPMTSIVGWSNLLRKGDIDSTTFQVAVSSIEKNALAQASLIDDLLDVSSIVAGQLSLKLKPLDIENVVLDVVRSSRHVAESKNISLHMNSEKGISVTGDDIRLQQVLWNILINAVKYTPNNGDIWIDVRRQDNKMVLTVRDNGDGVDPEFLPHMFDSFRQQTSGSKRAHGGLGLGLSIAKQLVEMHQGTMSASSEGPGKGTTIQFELPANMDKKTSVAPHTTTSATTHHHPQGSSLRGFNILLIDDAPDIRIIASYILKREGASTVEAESVDTALGKLRQQQVDLIVCDIGMPHRDGFDFLKSFKSEFPQFARIPVLALTAFARDEEKTRILAAGFDEHIAKPVNPQILVKAIKDRLGSNC